MAKVGDVLTNLTGKFKRADGVGGKWLVVELDEKPEVENMPGASDTVLVLDPRTDSKEDAWRKASEWGFPSMKDGQPVECDIEIGPRQNKLLGMRKIVNASVDPSP